MQNEWERGLHDDSEEFYNQHYEFIDHPEDDVIAEAERITKFAAEPRPKRLLRKAGQCAIRAVTYIGSQVIYIDAGMRSPSYSTIMDELQGMPRE